MKNKEIILKGKGFILRPYRKGDEFSLSEIINNKNVQNLLRSKYKKFTPKEMKKNIKSSCDNLFIIDINGLASGMINIGADKDHSFKADFGYWLSKENWGKGIMTEVIKLATNYYFKKLKLRRIYAYTYPQNKASSRVLIKNGFKLEGILRNNVLKNRKMIDENLFSKIK